MKKIQYPLQNTNIVFREENDKWAVLFDPDSGETYGLDPLGIFVWKSLNGKLSIEEITTNLRDNFLNILDLSKQNVEEDVETFVNELVDEGLAVLS